MNQILLPDGIQKAIRNYYTDRQKPNWDKPKSVLCVENAIKAAGFKMRASCCGAFEFYDGKEVFVAHEETIPFAKTHCTILSELGLTEVVN